MVTALGSCVKGPLVTDEPVEFENYRLKFMEIHPLFLKEFIKYSLNQIKRRKKMSTCNRSDFRNTEISTNYA